MEDYLEGRENLKMVFMIVDFRHKPTEDDVLMYKYLKHYNIPVTVICTKVDKVSKNSHEKLLNQISKTLEVSKEELILFSSVTKAGKQETYSKLIDNLELSKQKDW